MRHWTMMVYMAGDNGKIFDDGGQLMCDLQVFGWRNLADMTAVGSTDQVAIVAQFDTLENRQYTPRFFIDGSKPAGKLVQKVPPVNTGDPKNLTDFIVWAATNYPAQRYALVLWNHGTGWKEDDIYARYREKVEKAVKGGETRAGTRGARVLRSSLFLATAGDIMAIEDDETRGICYDDSSMDFLDNRKMVEALQNAETSIGKRISLLGMDACLMSIVEVAHQLRDHAEVMVGSQEVEPGEGWPYGAILRKLVANPDMSSRELGAHIVQEYGAFYMGLTRGGGRSVTQSAIDLSSMQNLGVQIGKLAQALTARYDADFQVERAIGRALKRVQRFRGDRDYMDLYDFLQHMEAEYATSDELMAEIKVLRLSLEQSASGTPIIANVTGRGLPNAHGLSVYFPDQGCSKYYDDVEMAGMGWKDLICKQNRVTNARDLERAVYGQVRAGETIGQRGTLKGKPPPRYFASRIEGGPEAAGRSPQLLVGKRYDCVFGVKAQADPRGIAVEISPDDLAKMRDREVQVLAGGEGLEIRNSCVPLKIHQDYTSAEAAVNFNAVKPGPCNLQLLLLLDHNVVRTLRYDFLAVRDPGRISEVPPAEQGCDWPSPEECQRLRKQELHIMVSGGLEELMLHFVWGTASAEPLPLKEAVRRELEWKKQKFLSDYARSMRHTATAHLKPDAATEFLEDLKKLGEEIFRTLFILPARRGLRETGEEMRQLLRRAHPAPIQIFPGQEHLPWMFLSDGEGALGLRHGVEYILCGTLGLGVDLDLTGKPLRLVCGLAPVFESQKLEDGRSVLEPQREALGRLSKNRFEVRFAGDEAQWLQALRDPTDVFYAYCHGSSGNGTPCLWMTQRAKAISGSTIDSSPDIDWSRNPLVILSACTSGAIDPFRAMGLANSFMARGARGYIAAEGQIPATFASLFMKDFFEEFFEKGGKPVGEVLFELRQRFLDEMNNPWGLLFTQFCRSEIMVRSH